MIGADDEQSPARSGCVAAGHGGSPLAIGREALCELRDWHLGLAAAVEVANGRDRTGELVLADQHRDPGMDLVRALHAPAHIAGIAEIDVEARSAQVARTRSMPGSRC